MKNYKLINILVLSCISSLGAWANPVSIQSPDGKTVIDLSWNESSLKYSLVHEGEVLLKPAEISLISDASYKFIGQESKLVNESWKPVWGSYSEINDHCNELTLKLEASGLPLNLICRVYDDSVGFRFEALENESWKGKELSFSLQCAAAADFVTYAPAKGEKDPVGPIPLSKFKSLSKLPVILNTASGSWMALLESDLYSATSFNSIGGYEINNKNLLVDLYGKGTAKANAFITPWRVILIGDSPGDLLNSQTTLNLAAPNEIEDASWIKPGKGLWDWRVHGYDNGEFKYGIDTRSYMRFIDFAAKHGIEYFTIDDHWYNGGKDGELVTDPNVDIEKVMSYGKEKGVEIILYFDRRKTKGKLIADPELFDYYSSLGAAGMKYGFMGSKIPFTRSSIQATADKQMFIFYHDGPAALTGVERTMPNFFTREYCHAQQDSRRAYSPTGFLKMAMINALTGPLDQANGNFGIKSINAGEREKGPRKANSYVSTVVSEVARCLVISSALITLPDAPEEYAKKPDLFAFLTEMKATWDDTRVINSKMEEYITVARRTGDTWFVGSVNNEEPRSLDVTLDFLKPGVTYEAELFEDTKEAHGFKNPEVYQISKKQVKAGDVISAVMAHGGGHAMIIRPL
ncbi:MAG: glycoside hydrolase family 97 catalytic domain-containing protein [Akkermansiaceae bacterium]